MLGVISHFLLASAQEHLPESPLKDQTWVRLGGPVGGIGYDIKMHPLDPDIMYVTDAWAGVHKSIDGGMTWFPINEGIDVRTGPSGDSVPVFSLSIDQNNPDTLWIGLQGIRGIYKSTDGGETWELMVNGIKEPGITFRGFTVDSNNPDVVYAAAEIPSHQWAGREIKGLSFDLTKGKVYKTDNRGQSWQEIWSGDNLARYVWIDEKDSNIIYVSTGIFDREAANSDWENGEAGGIGLLKSTDGGKNWKEINNENGLSGLYVGSLYMHPDNPDILLAGVGHDLWWYANEHNMEYEAGIYLSENQGENWSKVKDARIISAVEFCEDDSQFAYAAGELDFFRSEDGGITWQHIQPDYWGPPGRLAGIPIDLQCDPRNPLRVFVNSYNGGNVVSEDGGMTWTVASQGLTGAQVSLVAVDSENPAIIYSSSLEGIARSLSGGASWENMNFGKVKNWTAGLSLNPNDYREILVSFIAVPLIQRSTDGGYTWNDVFEIQSTERNEVGFVNFARAPSNDEVIYGVSTPRNPERNIQSYGVARSMDGGLHWELKNNGLPDDLNVNTVIVHPQNPLEVWVGTVNNGVYKSIDGGEEWEKSSSGIHASNVRSLAVDPSNPERLYAGTAGQAIFISDDEGNTWIMSAAGMDPEATISSIVIDPVNPNIVWAADQNTGVYYSNNYGKNWQNINQGLDVRAVNSLSISTDGLVLHAGTEGSGVYRLSVHNQDYFDSLAPHPTPIPTSTAPEPTSTKQPTVYQPTSELITTTQPAEQKPEQTITSSQDSPISGSQFEKDSVSESQINSSLIFAGFGLVFLLIAISVFIFLRIRKT